MSACPRGNWGHAQVEVSGRLFRESCFQTVGQEEELGHGSFWRLDHRAAETRQLGKGTFWRGNSSFKCFLLCKSSLTPGRPASSLTALTARCLPPNSPEAEVLCVCPPHCEEGLAHLSVSASLCPAQGQRQADLHRCVLNGWTTGYVQGCLS